MRTIKVDATNSTNSFLRDMYRENPTMENLCLSTYEQVNGRGQKGTSWQAKAGKNLTFSMFFTHLELDVTQQFKLSAMVSLATLNALKMIGVDHLKIKWPNDILADSFKIGGILIENFLKGNKIHASIIGMGLNVNQKNFDDLPKAASLSMLTGKSYDLALTLDCVTNAIEKQLLLLNELSLDDVLRDYHKNLFAINKISTFELPNTKRFPGIIQGVDSHGKLEVLTEGNRLKRFEVKQVKLLY